MLMPSILDVYKRQQLWIPVLCLMELNVTSIV